MSGWKRAAFVHRIHRVGRLAGSALARMAVLVFAVALVGSWPQAVLAQVTCTFTQITNKETS